MPEARDAQDKAETPPTAPAPAAAPSGGVEPLERGAAMRRQLAMKLPVPDLARDAGGALVVDTAALELGADEIAGPLADVVDITSLPSGAKP